MGNFNASASNDDLQASASDLLIQMKFEEDGWYD